MEELYDDIHDSKIYTIVGYVNEEKIKKNKRIPYI